MRASVQYRLANTPYVTMDEIEKWSQQNFHWNDMAKYGYLTITDFYHSEDAGKVVAAKQLLEQINNKILEVLEVLNTKEVPYFDAKDLKKRVSDAVVSTDEEDFNIFPVPVYVSADDEENTIGLLLDEKGNFKYFEGNEEATEKTLDLIDKLLGVREEQVYGYHGELLVKKIKQTKMLPVGIYVSPNKEYAERHWQPGRVLFTCIINTKDVNQVSNIDWVTRKPTQCKNLKILKYASQKGLNIFKKLK